MPFAEPEGAVCFELTLTCIMLRMCSRHIYGQAAESVISRNMVHTLDDNSLPGNWRETERPWWRNLNAKTEALLELFLPLK